MRIGLVLLLGACGGAKDGDSSTATTDSAPGMCWETAPAECASAGCSPIDGRPVTTTADGACVDFGAAATPRGCQPRNLGCPAVETLAHPPDDPDTCWWFGGCVPADWVVCEVESWDECG
ncbi:MAG: hypothetical protein ACI8PZ_006213 [Myxococcota bacterium]|jgi:hypothetical protein